MPTASNLFFISALLCIVQLCALCSLVRSGIAGIREWCLANLIAFLAFILYGLGDDIPPLLGYEVANASYALATSAMLVGFCRFFGKRIPWPTLIAVNVSQVALVAFFHYVQYSFAWRTIAVSVSQVILLSLIVGTLLRSRKSWASPYPYLFTIGLAGLVAFGNASRALIHLAKQGELTSLLQPAPWNLLFLTLGAMVLPAMTMGAIMIVHDRMMAKAEHAANRDFLTGAWSRRAFFEFAEREMALLQRAGGKLSLLVMDVDHFKSINDRWGHAAGDQVLAEVVATATTIVRSTDYFARIGGEEFAALLPATSLAEAARLAERLRAALDTPLASRVAGKHTEGAAYTVSIGVAELREETSFAEGLQRADAALYRAKQAGRNCVVLEDETVPATKMA